MSLRCILYLCEPVNVTESKLMSRFGGKKWSILVSAAVYSYKNNSEVVSTYCSGYSAQVVTYFNVIVVYLD